MRMGQTTTTILTLKHALYYLISIVKPEIYYIKLHFYGKSKENYPQFISVTTFYLELCLVVNYMLCCHFYSLGNKQSKCREMIFFVRHQISQAFSNSKLYICHQINCGRMLIMLANYFGRGQTNKNIIPNR